VTLALASVFAVAALVPIASMRVTPQPAEQR
jgi:hypothetical protein